MTQTSETDELVSDEVKKCVQDMLKEMGIKGYSMDISAGTIRGDNYLGVIAKVAVDGIDENEEKKNLKLIVKSAPKQENFRSMVPVRGVYEREIFMYSEVFPQFYKLQEELGILQPFTSTAKCYKTTFEDMNEAIIMEDMKHLGYVLKDRHVPLDYKHVRLVMREYGKFHALSFAMKDQKPEVFQEFVKQSTSSFWDSFTEEQIKNHSQLQSERALQSLDPVEHKEARAKFENFQDNLYFILKDIFDGKAVGEYGVITHSDCWINNMLFKYGNSLKPDEPTDLCFLDWQLSCYGSPAMDLSYFIFTTTEQQLREEHYEDLIQEYYDTFSSFLRKLGGDPEKLFPFSVLQQHLKMYSRYGLNMATMVVYLMGCDADEIPDMHSIKDEEDAIKQFSFESKNADKYKTRMRGIILDFVKLQYL